MGRAWALDPNEVFDFKGLGVDGTFTRMEGPWRIVGCPACGTHHFNDEVCPELEIVPLGRDPANAKVKEWHRHHKPVVGYKFAVGLKFGEDLVGIAIAGRPVSRMINHHEVIEITRVATNGHVNACSKLYSACCTTAKGMGYYEVITYTLPEEGGASLRAAGFVCEGEAGGGSWDRKGRRRTDKAPTEKKHRWRRVLKQRKAEDSEEDEE